MIIVDNLPPIPYSTPMFDRGGNMTTIWIKWFQALWYRVGGATGSSIYISDDNAAVSAGEMPTLNGIRQEFLDSIQEVINLYPQIVDSYTGQEIFIPPQDYGFSTDDISSGIYQLIKDSITTATVPNANNLIGGLIGYLPYQSGVDTTTFLPPGDSGKVLTSNGTSSAPSWEVIPSLLTAPVTKTADFILGSNENWVINNKAGSTCTVTMPSASSYVGRVVTFKNLQAFTLVSNSSNICPAESGTPGTGILLGVPGNWATVVSDGSNWIVMQQAPNNVLLLD